MNGGDSSNSEFLDSALVFDLGREGAGWETLPDPPFRRRALAVGALGGKVYAIGGLTDDGKVVKSVDIYDPAAQPPWSHGPELPGSKRQGFAPVGVRRAAASCMSTGSTARCSGSARLVTDGRSPGSWPRPG